jgi:cell division septation protein DedD
MRIDYSEPKKSYTTPQTGQNRPRQESSSGSLVTAVVITCLISSGVGFGSGWMLSARSTKKAFQLATQQQSIENSTRLAIAPPQPPKPQIAAAQAPDTQQSPTTGAGQVLPVAPGAQTTPEPPLSFYKNLPSGQKNNVLGSGINAKEEKPAKQPLQAAIPSNLTKPSPPQVAPDNAKPPTPANVEKAAIPSAFTVQIASFSLKSEAEATKTKLAGKGYNVYISESNQGTKGTWYRVRIGKGLEHDAAKELAGKLGKGAMAIPEKD